ncbi:MAG: hypothetical protein EOO20_23215 [Chryseobacterium sp.]|nr:MAG: hypothetical protein EOO20_23215 [Chryseobacterium sp.]
MNEDQDNLLSIRETLPRKVGCLNGWHDCKKISIDISLATGEYLSISTIKRIFRIISNHYLLSPAVHRKIYRHIDQTD